MNTGNSPLISVIVAIYNPGEHLRKCLDSITGQTYKNLEIILVDDGSTDNSLAVCKEYAEKDSRIIVHHKENSGVSATRNAGIRLAHGDYFSFIDSDDYLDADAYEYMINLIKVHNVDAVNYEHYITYPDRELTHKLPDDCYGLMDREQAVYQMVHNVMFAWNKLFSSKVIADLWFDETIARGEDSLFSIFAFHNADKIWFDKRPLYHYIQSNNSAVRGTFRKSQLSAIKLIDIYEPFFKENYPDLYDTQMSMLLNLMTTLYFDMCTDKADLKNEKALALNAFKELYSKINLTNISSKRRATLRLFRTSPHISYAFRRLNLKVRRLLNGK